MKKQVFLVAHQIKSFFTSFSDALKAAWKIVKIAFGWPVDIVFAKDSGEVREARAIAAGSLKTISQGYLRFVELLDDGRTQWRAFRIERLILN